MVLEIIKLDSDNEVVAVLSNGNHVLGRGDLLKCDDKRISRNHASLGVSKNEAVLTSAHINPCFYRKEPDSKTQILPQPSKIVLKDGDKFGFLPHMVWFKIRFIQEESTTNENGTTEVENGQSLNATTNRSSMNLKRPHEDELPSAHNDTVVSESKRIKPEENSGSKPKPADSESENLMKDDDTVIKNASSEIKKEENEPLQSENTPSFTSEDTSEVKEKDVKMDTAGTSGSSNNDGASKQRRERCWYGATCYRKNPIHRSDFTHPGDTDYLSDPEDGRPQCSYGAQCYRQNKIHRREYKHPPGGALPAKRVRKKAQTTQTNKQNDSDLDLSEDDEDPYANDGDESDDYVAESDYSSEHDNLNDSQEAEKENEAEEESQSANTESEDFNLLLKEAKQFTRS